MLTNLSTNSRFSHFYIFTHFFISIDCGKNKFDMKPSSYRLPVLIFMFYTKFECADNILCYYLVGVSVYASRISKCYTGIKFNHFILST